MLIIDHKYFIIKDIQLKLQSALPEDSTPKPVKAEEKIG